jgi:alkylation response protein AidB-like acyl-CoA dehydrogenase
MSAPDCIAQAGVCVGIAQAALDASVKYTKERTVVEPGTLAHFENVQRAIADMTIAVEAARLVAYRAALPAVEKGPEEDI